MDEPTDGMLQYQWVKRVLAGKITEVVPAGCYVQDANGDSILRLYEDGMTARYQPVVGDYWVVYDDGYQFLSPKAAFDTGYTLIEK